jgi:hypothetical protein
MRKLGGALIVFFVLFYFIAIYGKHSTCKEAGGVLVMGLGWFVCVEEVKARGRG